MIIWDTLTDESAYNSVRYNVLLWDEEEGVAKEDPYLDGKQYPTMGIGFNLKDTSNLYVILTEMGFNPNTTNPDEKKYIDRIIGVVNKIYLTGQQSILQNDLNTIMGDWKNDTKVSTHNGKVKRDNFKLLNNTNEITSVFNAIAPGYEAGIDRWITANGLSIDRFSSERAVLFSLAYNSPDKNKDGIPDLLGKGLANAITTGNRAEAWFEIRYNTNLNNENGVAKRRFFESELFGLYNDPEQVMVDDAKQVYKMLQNNRTKIAEKEALFGVSFEGTPGTRTIHGMTVLEAANYDYDVASFFEDGEIDTLEDSLNPAKAVLLADLRTQYQSNSVLLNKLTDGNFRSIDIYLNPAKESDIDRVSVMTVSSSVIPRDSLMIGMDQQDVLVGGVGNDVLIGGDGNDFLFGLGGDDVLYGGEGDDFYVLHAGDGTDTIEDKQGNNKVIFNGKIIDLLIRQADGSFKSPDGAFTAVVLGTDLIVTDIATGNQTILNENFADGDFGIHLRDAPTDLVTTNIIYGDRLSLYDPPQYDSLGNEITDPNVISPNKNDYLYDSAGNDRIEGGGGNDQIWALNGGDDLLLGGAGLDNVSGQSGNDQLEGGADSDVVAGGLGNDQVFGENAGEMEDLIAVGEVAPSINQRGDLVIGNAGDDYLYGANGKDVFFGGAGHDLIVGGGGDDIIFGDIDCTLANINWTAEVGPGFSVTLTNMNTLLTDFLGNDAIYAGTGNDLVYAGAVTTKSMPGKGMISSLARWRRFDLRRRRGRLSGWRRFEYRGYLAWQ